MSKLISWNIGGRVNRSEQLEWIRSQQADVLAFQEVANASVLRQELSELGFEHFECSHPTPGRKKLVAIASRKPLRRIWPFTRLPHLECAISCLISLGRKKVELHCVHVPNASKYGGPVKVKFLEALTSGVSTRKRLQLLVGDFNCPRLMKPVVTFGQRRRKDGSWQFYRTLDGIAGTRWDFAERSILRPRPDMIDAFIYRNRTGVVTYPKKTKGGGKCFDHIIASESIMPTKIRVADKVTRKFSDHAALVAEWD